MSDVRPEYKDEIELYELFEILLDGKWLISALVTIAVLLGGCFILLKDDIYESKLFYSINSLPPFYDEDKLLADFQTKFYSQSEFEEWKGSNSNSSLVYDNLSLFQEIDGFLLAKDADTRLVTLISKKQGGSFVLLKSNQLNILDDFFNYSMHINQKLTDEYIVRAKEELEIIESRFKGLDKSGINILEIALEVDRFIATAENEIFVFAIQRPSMPKKVSIKPSLVLAISFLLGGLIGVMSVLVRNAIKKRKEQLAKL